MTERGNPKNEVAPAAAPPCGWILYDASCGFCAWWVPYWEKLLKQYGFGISPLQAPWVRAALAVNPDELLADIRLLGAQADLMSGADVYRAVLAKIWWAAPVYWLSIFPLSRRLFDWGYRTFNRNRYRISRACRLPPEH